MDQGDLKSLVDAVISSKLIEKISETFDQLDNINSDKIYEGPNEFLSLISHNLINQVETLLSTTSELLGEKDGMYNPFSVLKPSQLDMAIVLLKHKIILSRTELNHVCKLKLNNPKDLIKILEIKIICEQKRPNLEGLCKGMSHKLEKSYIKQHLDSYKQDFLEVAKYFKDKPIKFTKGYIAHSIYLLDLFESTINKLKKENESLTNYILTQPDEEFISLMQDFEEKGFVKHVPKGDK